MASLSTPTPLGPSGLLDNVLHALRALRPCDPRNGAMYIREIQSSEIVIQIHTTLWNYQIY